MTTFNLTVEMFHLTCFKCGCQYALPKIQFTSLRNRGKPICCPSGHENFHVTDASIKAEDDAVVELPKVKEELQRVRAELTETKGMLVTLRQRAEQAEAAAGVASPDDVSEATAGNPSDGQTGVQTPEITPVVIYRNAAGKVVCPHCPHTTNGVRWLRQHLNAAHGDVATAAALHDHNHYRIESKTS